MDGAEPGDTLEVQILDLQTRVPYGMNSTGPTAGVFRDEYPGAKEGDPPLDIPEGTRHLIRTGMVNGKHVAMLTDAVHVPMNPFMGNMDFRALTVGATLYLPVNHTGARFYTGDPHGAQGDGEVSGNALEQSLTGVFRFVVHKGKTLTAPRAENATHYIVMGIDRDLDRAMKMAVAEAVKFLVEEKKMTPATALSLCSIAVDFHVAEAVDGRQVVVGKIPKSAFVM